MEDDMKNASEGGTKAESMKASGEKPVPAAQPPAAKAGSRFGTVGDMVTIALFAAIIFVVTFTVRIPIPLTSGGYINLGDAVIFMGALLIGGSRPGLKPALGAAGAAAIGSALADLTVGAAVYIVPTFIIKGLMGFVFRSIIRNRRSFPLFVVASIVCGAIMTAGYFLFEYSFFGLAYSLTSMTFDCIQWACNAVAAAILFPMGRRIEKSIR